MDEKEIDTVTNKILSCLSCNFKSQNQNDFLKHSRNHEGQLNFRIECFYCPQLYTKIKSHYKHTVKCKPKTPKLSTSSANSIEDKSLSNEVVSWQCKDCHENIQISKTSNKEDFKTVTEHIMAVRVVEFSSREYEFSKA